MKARRPSKLTVLVNEAAGTVGRQGTGSIGEAVVEAFRRRGVSADLQLVPSARMQEAAERARDEASSGNIDAVVVGGGDGTISTVAGMLAGTGIGLGVLPLGTLNHFAKDLGIPLDLDGAVNVICSTDPRPIDVAEVNGRVFVNNSSIGLYPYMVIDRERRRTERGQAKWLATVLAAFRTLRYLPRRRLSISAEGWTEPCRTPCLFVGNNEYGVVGPTLGKRERLDRGELCLYVARQRSRSSLLWLALRSTLGLIDEGRELRILKVGSADIQSRTSRLPVALEGEVALMRPPLHYIVRRGALCVFAPTAEPE